MGSEESCLEAWVLLLSQDQLEDIQYQNKMDYPILCICRKRKPLVLENPFLDDKRIIQPQWESGSEEFLVEALSELDIEGLLLNCVDPPSGFIDHDNLRCPGGAPIIIQNRFSVSQPHSSKKNYYCTWCQYRKTSKTCNKHDAGT